MKPFATAKQVYITFLSFAVMVLFLLFVPNNEHWYSTNLIYLPLLLTVQLVILKFIVPEQRLLIYFFWLLVFIFHFSHVILKGIQYDFGSIYKNDVFFRNSSEVVKQSTYICTKAVVYIFMGIIIFHLANKNRTINHSHKTIRSKTLKILFITVGFIFDIIYNIRAFLATYSYGYSATTTGASHYIIQILSYLLMTGIILFILDYELGIKIKNLVIVLFVAYKLIMMLSGLRAYSLINIIVLLYIHLVCNYHTHFSFKHILLILILAHIGGSFLIGIRESRSSGIDLMQIFSYMCDFNSNIIFNMMSEFGITQNVICQVFINTKGAAAYGTQLAYSLLTIIPFIGTIGSGIDFNSMSLEGRLDIHNYGGSFIGDILFDFGVNGLLLSGIITGIMFAFIFEKYDRAIQSHQNIIAAVYAPIIVDFMFCVRSSLAKMPRMICWYLLFIVIIRFIDLLFFQS